MRRAFVIASPCSPEESARDAEIFLRSVGFVSSPKIDAELEELVKAGEVELHLEQCAAENSNIRLFIYETRGEIDELSESHNLYVRVENSALGRRYSSKINSPADFPWDIQEMSFANIMLNRMNADYDGFTK